MEQYIKKLQSVNEQRRREELSERRIVIFLVILIIIGILGLFLPNAFGYTDEEIVNAIFLSEGGSKAQYLYGIRSVPYDTPQEARRICLNTVRNNRKRFADYGHKDFDTYLEFLASRYCPVGAENDPKGLNKNWLKNVKWFLKKGGV